VDCYCDNTVAVADPGDCAHPEQFTCFTAPDTDASVTTFSPLAFPNNWYAFADCFCDTSRPFLASQCDCERCGFECVIGSGCLQGTVAYGTFGASTDAGPGAAQYACACLPPPVMIR
jgi:hypothetical protein